MKHRINFNQLVKPQITIRALDCNGKELWRQQCTNSLTYAAADVFTNAWLRSGPCQVTHLYARFGGQLANQGWLAMPHQDVKAVTRNDFTAVTEGDTTRGGLWVPVLTAPTQTSSDVEHYSGNQATFYFRIPYNLAVEQTEPDNFRISGQADDSYIFALGLAVAFNFSDRNQDRVVSVLQATGWNSEAPAEGNFTAFTIPPGGQMAIDYTVPFVIHSV